MSQSLPRSRFRFRSRSPRPSLVLRLRARLRMLLFPGTVGGRWARRLDALLFATVVVSLFALVFDSVHSFHDRYGDAFRLVEHVSTGIFALEYLARLWVCANGARGAGPGGTLVARWRWATSPSALVDLAALLPSLVELLFPGQYDLGALRVYRLMRMLKLGRHAHALGTLRSVIRREFDVLLTSALVMLLVVVFTACLVWLCEHDAQPQVFDHIPRAIYWAVVTLSSIGYGDMVPITPLGRLATVTMSLVGISLFALPAGVLGSGFTEQLRLDREAFAHRAFERIGGRRCGPAERERRMVVLRAEGVRLHLKPDDVDRIVRQARHALAIERVAERRWRNQQRALEGHLRPRAAPKHSAIRLRHAPAATAPVAPEPAADEPAAPAPARIAAEDAFPQIRMRLLSLMQLAVAAGADVAGAATPPAPVALAHPAPVAEVAAGGRPDAARPDTPAARRSGPDRPDDEDWQVWQAVRDAVRR